MPVIALATFTSERENEMSDLKPTPMFEITKFNLEEISNRYIYGSARVKGYWSRDPITMYLQRTENAAGEVKWEATISHSTGGRDPKVVESDMEAARNFGAALVAVADYCDEFLATEVDTIEAAYQKYLDEVRAAHEAEVAAKEKAIEDDKPLGYPSAHSKLFELEDGKMVRMYRRGSNYPVLVTCQKGFKTLFYVNGNRTAKKEVLDILANSSARTQTVEMGK